MPPRRRVELAGVQIDSVSAGEAVDHVAEALARGRGGWLLTINLDILRRITRDGAFAGLCRATTLRVADGMPLVWASRLQRTPLPERVAGSDLIWSLTSRAAADGRRVFLLGGNPGAAVAAARILQQHSPDLHIVGTECPPFGFEYDPDYMAGLIQILADARPDILYVALGSPKQERLIDEVRERVPGCWCIGVGISFSFVSGEVARAPEWVQRAGLEWLHRMIQEPRRLTRRYLIYGIPFALQLLGEALLRGAGRRSRAPWDARL